MSKVYGCSVDQLDTRCEVPGPGRYLGLGLAQRVTPSPCAHVLPRRKMSNGYWWSPTPGPDVYRVEGGKLNELTKMGHRPVCKFTRDDPRTRDNCIVPRRSTCGAGVGPGSYTHALGLAPQRYGKQF